MAAQAKTTKPAAKPRARSKVRNGATETEEFREPTTVIIRINEAPIQGGGRMMLQLHEVGGDYGDCATAFLSLDHVRLLVDMLAHGIDGELRIRR
jgi:hypothetical protein